MEVFQDYALYYNAFYQDKNYAEEARQIDMLLKKCGVNISHIINYGCGTGRHDIELSKLGYHCTGIDISPLMVDIAAKNANQAGMDIEFSTADIRTFKPVKKYDAVISLFHVMSYQNKNEEILSAFQSARKCLNDGYFLFDCWYGPGVLSDKPAVRVKEFENKKYKLVRIAKPIMHDKENTVDVHYDIFVFEKETGKTEVITEVHSMRYFFRPEIELLLNQAGFKLIDNLDCRTLGKTNYDTWTSYFIAESV